MFYHTQYTSQATSSTIKKVRCEECDHRYAYEMERTGVGTGSTVLFNIGGRSAAASAESGASNSLRRQLRGGVDVVPCPKCGHVQDHMIPRARYLYLLWMWKYPIYVPAVLFLAAIVFRLLARMAGGVNAQKTASAFAIASAVAGGLIVLSLAACAVVAVIKYLLSQTYDPNRADVEDRIAEGQDLALAPDEYDRRFRPKKAYAGDPDAPLKVDDFGLR